MYRMCTHIILYYREVSTTQDRKHCSNTPPSSCMQHTHYIPLHTHYTIGWGHNQQQEDTKEASVSLSRHSFIIKTYHVASSTNNVRRMWIWTHPEPSIHLWPYYLYCIDIIWYYVNIPTPNWKLITRYRKVKCQPTNDCFLQHYFLLFDIIFKRLFWCHCEGKVRHNKWIWTSHVPCRQWYGIKRYGIDSICSYSFYFSNCSTTYIQYQSLLLPSW